MVVVSLSSNDVLVAVHPLKDISLHYHHTILSET